MVLKQLTGTVGNIRSTIGDVSLTDLIPPSWVSTLLFIRDSLPRGLGFANRTSHLTGVVVLTVVMVIASATLLTWAAVAYFVIAFPVALLRFIPAINDRWPVTSNDWPFWNVGGGE